MAEALSPLHSAFHPSFLSFLRATCQIEKFRSEKKGGGRGKSQGTVESSQKRVSRCHLICWAARTGGGGVSVSLRYKKKKKTAQSGGYSVKKARRKRGEGRSPSTGFAPLKVLFVLSIDVFFFRPACPRWRC